MTEILADQQRLDGDRNVPASVSDAETCRGDEPCEKDESLLTEGKDCEKDESLLKEEKNSEKDESLRQEEVKVSQDDTVTLSEETPVTQDWAKFADSTISFAIDTSGSTLGETLRREQQAIHDVSNILGDTAKRAARILPWNSTADPVTTLSGLSRLSSYGGTDPGSLIDASSSLAALQNSSLWFLITDGEIPESSLHHFASRLCSSRLHGTPCVIMVFGNVRGRPSDCNISVGVSVFAVVPDCLFLFMDTKSNRCYLLQCKGTFTEVLEKNNQQQPVLDDNTAWSDLPQITLDDLSCVRVPKHRVLQPNEIYLDADLVVNLGDLFAGRVTEKKVVDSILDSPEYVRNIVMTAQTRGLQQQVRDWLVKQEIDLEDLPTPAAPKFDITATNSISTLMQNMAQSRNRSQDNAEVSMLQAQLRASNSSASVAYNTSYATSSAKAYSRKQSVNSGVTRTRSSVTQARDLSITHNKPLQKLNQQLLTPGFHVPSGRDGHFQGTCPLCGQDKATLALLLREPPRSQSTRDFPATGSKSSLAFPLAMGNFRETDVICSSLYCDACCYGILQASEPLDGDNPVCALPLVSYAANKKAYNRQLDTAFENRFDEISTPLVFVAVLCTALQKVESKGKDSKLLTDALRWCCRDVLSSVSCPDPLTWSLTSGSTIQGTKPLQDVLTKSLEDAVRATSASYFQYPVEGFVVATKLLSQTESNPTQVRNSAKKAVFQRLLFHITEEFDKQLKTQGRIVVHLTMSRLLILERNRKERAGSVLGDRQFASFRGIAGLTRNLLGDRKTIQERLAITVDDLVAASLLESDFLKAFKKLGPLYDWVESQSGHALAIFLHYLYRYNLTETWTSSDAHYMSLAKTPVLAPVFLEPSEISAGKAERLIGKLPPFDTIGAGQD